MNLYMQLGVLCAVQAPGQPAQLVIENARIWSDGLPAFVEFAAVTDGRFVHVGARDERLIGPLTQRINAHGRVVVPGLIDSHVHMLNGGLQLGQLQLREVGSKEEFVAEVRRWAAQLKSTGWILGGRWSVESWSNPQSPTKEWVDDVSDGRPLFLTRMDGHSALANGAALQLAGITRDGPPDPPGGVIDRDPATGEPTGILRESAMDIVARHVPELTIDDRLNALNHAIDQAIRHGITAVSDIPEIADLPVYERLLDSPLRVRFFLYPTARDWQQAAALAGNFAGRENWLEIRGLKTYVDGSLGSRTAYMHEAFCNNEPERASWRGLVREGIENGALQQNLAAARNAGLQPIAHAIGDEANHLLLDAYEEVFGNALRAARCRSEHSQHLLPRDIQRFGDLGVIASMQPYHKADDGRYAQAYIGAARSRSSYAFNSLLNAGAVVAFGSDWPVVTINPFLGMEAAVTGRTLDGRVWQAQENITVGEALRCYTSRGAQAAFAEDEIGRIEPGYRADFVILNRSPFDAHVDWAAIRPAAVFVEGRRVDEALSP